MVDVCADVGKRKKGREESGDPSGVSLKGPITVRA